MDDVLAQGCLARAFLLPKISLKSIFSGPFLGRDGILSPSISSGRSPCDLLQYFRSTLLLILYKLSGK